MSTRKMYEASLISQIKSVEKSDDSDDLIIEGYANTVSKDRAGDIIPKTAWESMNALTDYMKNPIILAFHNHSLPIGKMISHEITDLGLKIKAKISKSAGNVYELIKDGILSTFSVGFGILDAEYDAKTDTYYITDLELREVSVVSVPCNQDSTFSIAKSMESQDFENFKKNLAPEASLGDNKEEKMTLEQIQAQLEAMKNAAVDPEAVAKAAADAAAKAIADAEAEKVKAAKDAADAEKAAADAEKAAKAIAKAEAEELVKALKDELAAKDGAFSEMVRLNEEKITGLEEEIKQVVAASRSNPIAAGVNKGINGVKGVDAEEVDRLVMLGIVKEKGVFETDYGKAHHDTIKAVNASSSIQVSSDGYETEFSKNLIRDIQAELVVAPLFKEMQMNSANLTIPINPDRGTATWVSSANYGTDNSSGAEHTVTLTERTLKTFKLAAKSYLTEETSEDAILALVPIMRQHLVEAHAASIDNAFLVGDGTGKPKGLVTQAAAASATEVSAAKADGSVKVTALGIMAARKRLGLYGVKMKDIVCIVSQDAYWDLILDPEWADVQQVTAANATKLTGEVGNIYGCPVIVSNEFAAAAVSTAYAVLVNKTNFVTTRQRGMTVRSDFDVEKDRRVFVATQRLNLEPLIEASAGNGKGVVEITYAAT